MYIDNRSITLNQNSTPFHYMPPSLPPSYQLKLHSKIRTPLFSDDEVSVALKFPNFMHTSTEWMHLCYYDGLAEETEQWQVSCRDYQVLRYVMVR